VTRFFLSCYSARNKHIKTLGGLTMTRSIRTLFIVSILLLGTAGFAQAGLNVFGGLTLPQEHFSEVAKDGYHVGAEITIPIIPALLSVGGRGTVSMNEFDFSGYPAHVDQSRTWFTTELLGIAKVSLPITGVYAKVGVGANSYQINQEEDPFGEVEYESETKLSLAAGGGMSLFGLDLCGMYHVVKWDETVDDPDSVEDLEELSRDYSYWTVSVGFGF